MKTKKIHQMLTGKDPDAGFRTISAAKQRELLARTKADRAEIERRQGEVQINRPVFNALRKTVDELRLADLVDNDVPMITKFDAFQAAKSARGAQDGRDPELSGFVAAMEHGWRKDPAGVYSVANLAGYRETYRRLRANSSVVKVIDEVFPKYGFNTLPVKRLAQLASEIEDQNDFNILMQRARLDGNRPEQIRARAFVMECVNRRKAQSDDGIEKWIGRVEKELEQGAGDVEIAMDMARVPANLREDIKNSISGDRTGAYQHKAQGGDETDREILTEYTEGKSIEQIIKDWGLTREEVEQILDLRLGSTRRMAGDVMEPGVEGQQPARMSGPDGDAGDIMDQGTDDMGSQRSSTEASRRRASDLSDADFAAIVDDAVRKIVERKPAISEDMARDVAGEMLEGNGDFNSSTLATAVIEGWEDIQKDAGRRRAQFEVGEMVENKETGEIGTIIEDTGAGKFLVDWEGDEGGMDSESADNLVKLANRRRAAKVTCPECGIDFKDKFALWTDDGKVVCPSCKAEIEVEGGEPTEKESRRRAQVTLPSTPQPVVPPPAPTPPPPVPMPATPPTPAPMAPTAETDDEKEGCGEQCKAQVVGQIKSGVGVIAYRVRRADGTEAIVPVSKMAVESVAPSVAGGAVQGVPPAPGMAWGRPTEHGPEGWVEKIEDSDSDHYIEDTPPGELPQPPSPPASNVKFPENKKGRFVWADGIPMPGQINEQQPPKVDPENPGPDSSSSPAEGMVPSEINEQPQGTDQVDLEPHIAALIDMVRKTGRRVGYEKAAQQAIERVFPHAPQHVKAKYWDMIVHRLGQSQKLKDIVQTKKELDSGQAPIVKVTPGADAEFPKQVETVTPQYGGSAGSGEEYHTYIAPITPGQHKTNQRIVRGQEDEDDVSEYEFIQTSVPNSQDLVSIAESKLGWSMAEQLEKILKGTSMQEMNSNALKAISGEFLRNRPEPEAAQVADEIDAYLSAIHRASRKAQSVLNPDTSVRDPVELEPKKINQTNPAVDADGVSYTDPDIWGDTSSGKQMSDIPIPTVEPSSKLAHRAKLRRWATENIAVGDTVDFKSQYGSKGDSGQGKVTDVDGDMVTVDYDGKTATIDIEQVTKVAKRVRAQKYQEGDLVADDEGAEYKIEGISDLLSEEAGEVVYDVTYSTTGESESLSERSIARKIARARVQSIAKKAQSDDLAEGGITEQILSMTDDGRDPEEIAASLGISVEEVTDTLKMSASRKGRIRDTFVGREPHRGRSHMGANLDERLIQRVAHVGSKQFGAARGRINAAITGKVAQDDETKNDAEIFKMFEEGAEDSHIAQLFEMPISEIKHLRDLWSSDRQARRYTRPFDRAAGESYRVGDPSEDIDGKPLTVGDRVEWIDMQGGSAMIDGIIQEFPMHGLAAIKFTEGQLRQVGAWDGSTTIRVGTDELRKKGSRRAQKSESQVAQEMKEKGYTYAIIFEGSKYDNLYTKTLDQASELMRTDFKEEKNFQIVPIDKIAQGEEDKQGEVEKESLRPIWKRKDKDDYGGLEPQASRNPWVLKAQTGRKFPDQQPAKGDMKFNHSKGHREGQRWVVKVKWNTDQTKGMSDGNISAQIKTYIQQLGSEEEDFNWGDPSDIQIDEMDIGGGEAVVSFKSTSINEAVPAQVPTDEEELASPGNGKSRSTPGRV